MPATSQRMYEHIFISPPNLSEEAMEKVIGDVQETLSSQGAEIIRLEKWGRKRLAYPIRKHDEGWYVMLHVKGPGDALQEVERKMRISENFIKYLTVRLDDVAGAVEASEQRIVRMAQQEEERRVRAAERAAREEAERQIPDAPGDDDDDDDEDGEDR
jgi:small subunit ribosomal protein S6